MSMTSLGTSPQEAARPISCKMCKTRDELPGGNYLIMPRGAGA